MQDYRFCTCRHAEFAHNNLGHPHVKECRLECICIITGCDLCQCKRFRPAEPVTVQTSPDSEQIGDS